MCLDNLGVPGPLSVYAPSLKFLGEGGQFIVHGGDLLDPSTSCEYETLLEEVAIKRPKFGILPDGRLSLTSSTTRRQINDFYLEVAALRLPDLSEHRNIVRLLGWASEESVHQGPMLVFELALGNMASIFELMTVTWEIKQQLCLDVGKGLDAIHKAGIVHSDLKPENVLVFYGSFTDVPFIAKLADFGGSNCEPDSTGDGKMQVTCLSYQWSAPEIALGDRLSMLAMVKADAFSYGLLVLSFNCLDGVAPVKKDALEARRIARRTTGIPVSYLEWVETTFAVLLHRDPLERPSEVQNLLINDSEASLQWKFDETRRVAQTRSQTLRPHVYPWKLPSISGPHLFAMFLLKTVSDSSLEDIPLRLKMLLDSARKGYIPAQAIAGCVCESYDVTQDIPEAYLFNGASSGSLHATFKLAVLRPRQALAARSRFREQTGYNQFFSPLENVSLASQSTLDADGNSVIHRFATQGFISQLQKLLLDSSQRAMVNHRNRHGETALYKACLAGCWESVTLLCRHGADASVPSFLNGLTCLHWLFNLPPDRINVVLSELFKAGASINAMAHPRPSPKLADHHFPFYWPLGTPLHAAVHARNRVAVEALMACGADPCTRDIRDPYVTDDNVRQMHIHGTAEEGETSRPEKVPQGFTPVDLTAALHDHGILECFAVRPGGGVPGLNFTPDEEGYTPFHRLSYLRVCRTADGRRFWYPAFRGRAEVFRLHLTKTVDVLKRLGGNLNQLTNTPKKPALEGVSGLSPLMIAATKADYEAVHALVKAGADVNQVNRDGFSSLMLLPNVHDPHVTPGSLTTITQFLLRAGASINTKSSDGTTPLGAAITRGSMTCIKLLVQAKAELSPFNRGLSVIGALISNSSYVHALIPPNVKTQRESEQQERDVAEILETVCASEHSWAHYADMDNGSLLHYAAYAGLPQCASVLVRAGFDREQVRKLHFAGPVPYEYDSAAGCMPEGTPLHIASQAQSVRLSPGRLQLFQKIGCLGNHAAF